MKRLVVSIVIIVVIAALSTASVVIIRRSNERLNELVALTEQAYKSGSDAQKALGELEDYWQDYYLLMSYITAEPTMQEMSRAVKKLPSLLERDSDEFLAELKSISDWAQLLYDTQFPDLSSIF